MSTIGNVAVREAPAAEAVRRRINLIEGANITITVADDPANHEVDVTIAAVGTSADLSQLFPVTDPDSYKGNFPTVRLIDGIDMSVRQTFMVPKDITTITVAAVVLIPNGTGNLRRGVTTDFGALCASEQYNTHSDSIAAGVVAVDNGEIECINITAALTGSAAEDIVGLTFTRYGSDATDTVNADVHYVGIWIKGT